MSLRGRLDGDRRRRYLLLFLLLLVVIGAGIGDLVPGFGPGSDDPQLTVGPPTTDAPSPTAQPGTTTQPPRTGTTTFGGTPPPTSSQPPTTTPPPDDPVDLRFEGDSVVLSYENVAPGDGGTETVAVGNEGTRAGNLSVTHIVAADEENGVEGAESAVDDTPDEGEFSEHLRVAVAVNYPDGHTTPLFGTGDGARPVTDLAALSAESVSGELPPGETATVAVTWLLPADTGNVVQSDRVSVDVTFALRSEEE